MADIKQAGVWLDQGREVKRATWIRNSRLARQSEWPALIEIRWDDGPVRCSGEFVLSVSDLITEDWEIA